MIFTFIVLFITIAGLIVGLGAVSVIDMHGFLGRKSNYWTRATIQTHKVTKPLIWLGSILFAIGISGLFLTTNIVEYYILHMLLVTLLVINGIFLSFYVSPTLLLREKEGKAEQLLPKTLQNKILISFVVSFVGWWSNVVLLCYEIVKAFG
jgi:hypothetical protein